MAARRPFRFRRVIAWTGASLGVVVGAAALVSVFRGFGVFGARTGLGTTQTYVVGGVLLVTATDRRGSPGGDAAGRSGWIHFAARDWPQPAGAAWRPTYSRDVPPALPTVRFSLPLWMPLVLCGAMVAAPVWIERRRRRRGRCMGCGYDLRGVPRSDGVVRCPECGSPGYLVAETGGESAALNRSGT